MPTKKLPAPAQNASVITNLTTDQFTFAKGIFTAESSTIFGPFDPAFKMPQYIYLKSTKTEVTIIFERKQTEVSLEDEILSWNYVCNEKIGSDYLRMTILND
jgi:hypothetical protein